MDVIAVVIGLLKGQGGVGEGLDASLVVFQPPALTFTLEFIWKGKWRKPKASSTGHAICIDLIEVFKKYIKDAV